jgi:hypothetical protein
MSSFPATCSQTVSNMQMLPGSASSP